MQRRRLVRMDASKSLPASLVRIECKLTSVTTGAEWTSTFLATFSNLSSRPRVSAAAPASGCPSPLASSRSTAAISRCARRWPKARCFRSPFPSSSRLPRLLLLLEATVMYNILVLDDQSAIINAMRRAIDRIPSDLLDSRCRVHGFDNPENALESLRDVAYDAVVSDLRMPGVDGLDFLRQARELQPDAVR